jgi:hypothetical protein
MHEFGEANVMWVQFKAGNEAPWTADMKGSREASRAFQGCTDLMRKKFPPATQPYGNQPQASQPYGPTDKTVKTTREPAAKKDDGSI